ncbi:MAG: GFA family protein [Rubrivivax sp.]|nr:GFA family protein [Rubrivivax sp.]
MLLEGSCHCRAVRFSLQSNEPTPFMRCYCSVCRKTAGSGGFAINLGGEFKTLKVKGRANLGIYRARLGPGRQRSPAERHFCKVCGSPLWVWDPRWPALVHPHAGAIDTPLPPPPKVAHIMLGSKADWVAVQRGRGDDSFEQYPNFSLAQWHARRRPKVPAR